MPVTIGAKPAGDFSNPIELLGDCHRRIEGFLAVLVAVARQARGGPMTPEQKEQWLGALDYFRNAAPRHTADEEETLFPRLREIELSQVCYVLSKIHELENDHEQASEWRELVEQLGRRWLADGQLTPEDTESLGTVLAQLSELYTHHIALEDQSVFPLAVAVLPRKQKANIGIEMAKRRGLNPQRTQEQLISKFGNIEG